MLRLLVFCVLLSLGTLCQAAIIFDTGAPTTGASGNEVTQWVQTGGFSIAGGGSVASVGAYLGGFGGIGNWDGTVQYWIFADSGGQPGSILASGAGANAATADTGVTWCCSGNIYLLTFDLTAPFAAGAGTPYWLGLHLSPDWARDEIYWSEVGSGTSWESDGGTFNNWANNYRTRAFFLSDTPSEAAPIPEPATAAMLGLGLAGLGLALRSRRR